MGVIIALTAISAVMFFLAFRQVAKLERELVTVNIQIAALQPRMRRLKDDVLRFPGYESSHSARELGYLLEEESRLAKRKAEILWLISLVSSEVSTQGYYPGRVIPVPV